jgi:putative endonuclease
MRFPWTRSPLSRPQLGALGERHAARFLRAKGYRLLEANFATRIGELDLIARDGDTLVFVEVRTRTSEETITPLTSVNALKQEHVLRTARAYLRTRRLPECLCRCDVVEVIATPTGHVREVRHYEGAFIEWEQRRG